MADLTEKDLENMKNHKYQTTGYTTIDNKMNPFWTKCASFLPYSISPNMVTATGLFCQLMGITIIGLNDLTLSKELPSYVYIFCAFMLFCAQTFDAIDGKHARNTKRSSSLGQLMDHGCDANDNFLFCLMISQSHLLGPTIYTQIMEIGIQIAFYGFTLEEHFSGVLRTQSNDIGVTEYQFFSMFVVILPVFIGHVFSRISIFGMKLTHIILIFVLFAALYQTFDLIRINYNGLADAYKKWNHLIELFVFNIIEVISTKMYFYQTKPFLIILLNGLYFSLMASKLIINNMAKREFNNFDIDIFVYIITILITVYIGNSILEYIAVIFLFVWFLYKYYIHVIMSIFRMMDYLKIPF